MTRDSGESKVGDMKITYGDGYALVETEKGKAMILVKKHDTFNPSVRGGAYRTEWVATARGQKFHKDTRKDAVIAAVESLRKRGFNL